LEKYLGNKASLLPLIEDFLNERVPEAHSLSDPFSGTTNVCRYFRSRGWNTACNDTNRFSYVLARTYLCLEQAPSFARVPGKPRSAGAHQETLERDFSRAVQRFGPLYSPDSDARKMLKTMSALLPVLRQLQEIGEAAEHPGVVTDYFTQFGSKSDFRSIRGGTGKRNYFSLENALFLDAVLATVRRWWMDGRLEAEECFLLLTIILEEVVITANVNGTFHDFNRNRLWPNALQPFFLRVPLITFENCSAHVANADALDAASWFPSHDVCYLDPPYNFRQYSAYYHFLNFVAAFPFLHDVRSYVEAVAHVRGQNPLDNVNSDFCYREKFVGSLNRLIARVDSEHVVLSYYGGRNHWNHWSAVDAPGDQGLHELSALFEDTGLFSAFEIVPALDVRRNYQSRGGEQKDLVNEYLFYGKRRRHTTKVDSKDACLQVNSQLGIQQAFSGHSVSQRLKTLEIA
jgi:adenine-specific DNA-methyltransferase